MTVLEQWAAALAVLLLGLALLPRFLRYVKRKPRKGGSGSGIMIGIGLAFAMAFDRKAADAIELIQQRKEIGDAEEGEGGDKPD